MRLNNHLLNSAVFGVALAAVSLLGSQSLRAQIVPEASSEAAARQFDTDNANDLNNVFNGRDSNGGSLLNLMNKVQNLNYYTPTRQEQLDSINGAAQEFHRKQQQRLQESPAVPASIPETAE